MHSRVIENNYKKWNEKKRAPSNNKIIENINRKNYKKIKKGEATDKRRPSPQQRPQQHKREKKKGQEHESDTKTRTNF